MENIVLLDFIPKKDFQFDNECLCQTIGVPTEFVVNKAQMCEPTQARIFNTRKWVVNGKIVDYDYLRKLDGFKGTCHHDSVLLVEVWVNNGEDGHTSFNHLGYRYIQQSLFQMEMEDIRTDDGLPTCMTWYWPEEGYPSKEEK